MKLQDFFVSEPMIAVYQGVLFLFLIFVIMVVVKAMLKTFLKEYLAVGCLKICCFCLKSEDNNNNNRSQVKCDKREDEGILKKPKSEM